MLANTGLQKVCVRICIRRVVTNCGDLNDRHFCRCGANKIHESQMTSVQSGLSLSTESVNAGNASHASHLVNKT